MKIHNLAQKSVLPKSGPLIGPILVAKNAWSPLVNSGPNRSSFWLPQMVMLLYSDYWESWVGICKQCTWEITRRDIATHASCKITDKTNIHSFCAMKISTLNISLYGRSLWFVFNSVLELFRNAHQSILLLLPPVWVGFLQDIRCLLFSFTYYTLLMLSVVEWSMHMWTILAGRDHFWLAILIRPDHIFHDRTV